MIADQGFKARQCLPSRSQTCSLGERPHGHFAYGDDCNLARAIVLLAREYGERGWRRVVDTALVYARLKRSGGRATPLTLVLQSPYPNPFRETLTVRFGLSWLAPVRVSVFDILGLEVAVMAEGLYARR